MPNWFCAARDAMLLRILSAIELFPFGSDFWIRPRNLPGGSLRLSCGTYLLLTHDHRLCTDGLYL